MAGWGAIAQVAVDTANKLWDNRQARNAAAVAYERQRELIHDTPGLQVAGLRAAGLNPALAYGSYNQHASSVAPAQTARGSSNIGPAISSAVQAAAMESDIAAKQAAANASNADAGLKAQQTNESQAREQDIRRNLPDEGVPQQIQAQGLANLKEQQRVLNEEAGVLAADGKLKEAQARTEEATRVLREAQAITERSRPDLVASEVIANYAGSQQDIASAGHLNAQSVSEQSLLPNRLREGVLKNNLSEAQNAYAEELARRQLAVLEAGGLEAYGASRPSTGSLQAGAIAAGAATGIPALARSLAAGGLVAGGRIAPGAARVLQRSPIGRKVIDAIRNFANKPAAPAASASRSAPRAAAPVSQPRVGTQDPLFFGGNQPIKGY